MNVSSQKRAFDLMELEESVVYVVSVRAYTIGTGPYSAGMPVMTLEAGKSDGSGMCVHVLSPFACFNFILSSCQSPH